MLEINKIQKEIVFSKENQELVLERMNDEIKKQVPEAECIDASFSNVTCDIYGFHFYLSKWINIIDVKPDCREMPETEEKMLLAIRQRKSAINKARAILMIFKYMIKE